jgi:succinoglycan biosynthesis transport protein ExoP
MTEPQGTPPQPTAAQAPVPSSTTSAEGGMLLAQLEALRRRAWPMAAVFVVVLAVGFLVARFLPPTYRSSGIILIEQQEIPQEFVRAAISSYADQRVQVISQRAMTASNLLEIVERYNLYTDLRGNVAREKLLERMRGDIGLDMISANVINPRSGGAQRATIAFEVSYENRSPELAARVANDLVSLYLRENLAIRQRLAASTTDFLEEESKRLEQRVANLEESVAEFKQRYVGLLPDDAAVLNQMIARTTEELGAIEARGQALDQQVLLLDAQLAQLITATASAGPAERLQQLRAELASANARFTPKHPEVQALEIEIATLEQELRAGADGTGEGDALPPSAAYAQLEAQRASADNQRAALAGARQDALRRRAELETQRTRLPQVEREYVAMMRDLQVARAEYGEIRQKLADAQLAENLETEQKGERFTLIEPPVVPGEPVRPDRQRILALTLLLAAGAAFGLMLLLEALDQRVYGRRQVVDLLGVPPLAIIPLVPTHARSGLRRWLAPAS